MMAFSAVPDSNHAAGSLPTREPAFLAVGKLRRPHGVHGEILMDIYTDFPERLEADMVIYVGSNYLPLRIVRVRKHSGALLLTLDGYTTPEIVGQFRNKIAYVTALDRPPLPDGDYYHHQLLGLRVLDESGMMLGQVIDILETGANDVLVLRPPTGPELLLPLIDEVILAIDLERGEILAHLLPGLAGE